MAKLYIKVIAQFDKEGIITPIAIFDKNDRRIAIQSIVDIRRVASLKGGGTGYRYQVVIEARRVCIWLEDTEFNKVIGARWFIEI